MKMSREGQKSRGSSYDSTDEEEPSEKKVQILKQEIARASVQKPKRKFNNQEEKIEFVQKFQAKLKTEICKNWEQFGNC